MKSSLIEKIKELYDLHEKCDYGCVYNCTKGFKESPICVIHKKQNND